jgi:hypothetical protein
VTLQVSGNPILTVSTQPLMFDTAAGSVPTLPQQISVSGSGFSIVFHVDTGGGSWLRAAPTDGTTPGVVNVTADPTGLAPGYYLGVVSIGIRGVTNSQQEVPVVFLVVAIR